MPPHSRGGPPDIEHPGAGTLFVHGQAYGGSSSKRNSLVAGARSRSRTPVRLRPSSNSRSRERTVDKLAKWPPEWQDVATAKDELLTLAPTGADVLLSRGVGDYTFFPAPEGLLGRGKFSTVYKVLGQDGKHYALKHTPLHPHHPLIAARLLREPTLLAQLPPHPCLVGVEGWIRTEGHFYLIEKYAASHIPLHTHPLPLRPSRAAYILDQLVSVVRDCMHRSRVCHRDLKGENVLVDIETGDVVVLDLGLATQFSASEPKLTTCCGSPAFHSPEIVNALNHPPGAVTYYGPELDIWCIALTLLALLSASRFPLGPSHRSRHTMASRVLDRLQELDTAYPPHRPATNWALSAAEHEHEAKEWTRVRRGLRAFLEMDGKKRMEGFRKFQFGQRFKDRLEAWTVDRAAEGDKEMKEEGGGGGFKQLSFLPTEVKYTLPLGVLPSPQEQVSHTTPSKAIASTPPRPISLIPPPAELVLANPTHESDRRVMSYVKYLLRTHGILYHCITTTPLPLLQLIVPLPPSPDPTSQTPSEPETTASTPWLTALFRRSRSTAARSASVPAHPKRGGQPMDPPVTSAKPTTPTAYLRCYLQLEFTHPVREQRPPARRAQSKPAIGASSSHTPRNRRRSVTQSQPASRSSSLAPAFLSRANVRNGAVSPPTPPTNGVGAEESLAVASLQQALLRITEVSPPVTKFEEEGGTGWWSTATSPRLGSGPLPRLGGSGGDEAEHADGQVRVSISASSRSGEDSGNTSPVISTPTTPSPAAPSPLPTEQPASRPPNKRATTSPRLNTISTLSPMAYRGLQPVSPSLALTPLPAHPHPLSPLSRQVSTATLDLQSNDEKHSSSSPSSVSNSTGPAPSQRRAASRPSSRLNSRANSRAASVVSTSTSASSTPHTTSDALPKARRTADSRTASTISTATTTYSNSPESIADPAPTPRAISYVFVRLSDARALPILRKALDQGGEAFIGPYPNLDAAAGPARMSGGGRGGRRKTSAEETVEEEEEERGRPRSREEPRSIGLGLSGSIGDVRVGAGGRGSGGSGTSKAAKGAAEQTAAPATNRREMSTGRKVLGMLAQGLGGGIGIGMAGVEEGERRRGGARTASAPPPAS